VDAETNLLFSTYTDSAVSNMLAALSFCVVEYFFQQDGNKNLFRKVLSKLNVNLQGEIWFQKILVLLALYLFMRQL